MTTDALKLTATRPAPGHPLGTAVRLRRRDEHRTMTDIAREAQKRAKIAADDLVTTMNPVKALSDAGIKSEWAYLGGFASIGLSLATWLISRGRGDDKPQSDRWGIFIGHWAPTFFALGIALKHEELDKRRP